MWHAELGDKLPDMWTGTNHRGVQLNDARAAVERWIVNYGQRCWLRQLTPYATREPGRPGAARDRADGRHAVPQHRTADGPMVSRAGSDGRATGPEVSRSWTGKVRESARRRRADERKAGLETAYCAETVAITYEEMGLLTTEKHTSWFDPGKFWSGDSLPLTAGIQTRRRDRRSTRLAHVGTSRMR